MYSIISVIVNLSKLTSIQNMIREDLETSRKSWKASLLVKFISILMHIYNIYA